MARETIVTRPTGDEGGGDDEDRAIRPQRIRDMVGQGEVTARIDIAVDASRKRSETLGHILFDGPPGLGKTTLAMAIPRELGVGFQIASGLLAVLVESDVMKSGHR